MTPCRFATRGSAHLIALQHGGSGGQAPAKVHVDIPDREPDATYRQLIPENQAVLHRLTGWT